MADKSKLIDIDGLVTFKANYDDEIDEKIAAAGVGVTYTLSKNTDGEIVLTGSDESVTKVTDANTTYAFTQSGTTLTITPSDGSTPITITLGEDITSEKIVNALGFTPYSKPSTGIPASDLASGVIPTTLPASDVKAWAKADTKPTYTASEVGALPDTTAIPTETTVSDWGFTKNTGTYSKPTDGIPKSDLDSSVQASLGKADSALQSFTETDPTVPSHVKAITEDDLDYWDNKVDESDLASYALVSESGYDLGLSIDTSTYVMTLELKNKAGTSISTKTIDFPIESMVVNASYKDGVITLTLQNGTTLPVDITSLVSGLVNDTFTIAGIDMKDNITVDELKTALGVPSSFAPTDAQANVIESIKVNGTAQTVDAKTVNITVPTKASDVGALPDTTVIPTITDTYSATSTNGMSGKAVASAISGKTDTTDVISNTYIDGLFAE